MGKCVYLIIFFYVSGLHFLSASTVVHFVQAGQNASLSCNLTNSKEIIWFQLLSEELVTLITVTRLSRFLNTAAVNEEYTGHFDTKENNSLEIIVVTEADLGLYYCAGRYDGTVRFGKGIRLTFADAEVAERELVSCWTLLACVAPVSVLFGTLCLFGLCFQSGKSKCLCNTCVNRKSSLKEVDLHYASLKHIGNARPTAQGVPGLAEGDVTYATVAQCVHTGT
ncbi:uncharacterized protein LOC120022426 [Salvelinus namaycush]|uniref:Uncharacterized protein LOC120022426 n=1 Tax=Salvelinus namaycush TaxID=8040 RepID=A0A8U0PD36_SALNM|nr:uncharacterized protein LOC120022426 [Salvelinus namaycush]XP_038822246.1 uncharacterized protein LOC120022426 [Salvelinus namaycush]